MVIQLRTRLILLVLVWLTGGASSASLAKYNCSGTCGGIKIPYPFGIGAGCYANESFAITCNYSSIPHKPYLTINNLEVRRISLELGLVSVFHPVLASVCPNGTNHRVVNLSSPFSYSDTYNLFTATGCNNQALMKSQGETIGGCLSICNRNSKDRGGCYGTNCCQTTIPPSLNFINASLTNFDSKTNDTPEGCKSAFIVDQNWFNNYLRDPSKMQEMDSVPAMLAWGTNGRCESFSNTSAASATNKSSSRLCKGDFAYCKRTSSNSSYICSCYIGDDGNPYLSDGCQGSFDSFYYGGKDSKKTRIIIIGVSTGGGLIGILLLLGGTWWLYKWVKRRKELMLKEKFFKRNGGLLLQQQLSSGDEGNVEKNKLFTLKELEKATDHFHEDRILGQGGQGTVYKGMLTDGKIVAIKKSKIVDEGKLEQFINEVVILSQINHRNVVKLHGCCLEAEVPLLVYEFIPNGTLYQYIHEQNEEFPLTWNICVRIAAEVSGALAYLHSAASIPIYHRDIKSTNIMLDEKFRAKVSDFGTSKSVAIDKTHLTTIVQGTFGYLDPEYFQSSQFTEKSDVYSFGVVLVELLTGQKPITSTISEQCRSLATYFILTMKDNHLFDILDARISKEGGKEEIIRVANLAKRCLNLSGRKRPTMREVAIELEGIRMSHGVSTIQQNYEEDEYVVNELTGPWDFTSTSTGTHLDSSISSSLDVQPLLFM